MIIPFIRLPDVRLPWAATLPIGLLLFTLSYACGGESPPEPARPAPTPTVIEVEVPVEVEKIIEVVKEVPVEVVVEKEVIREVPVEVEVEKVVVKEVPVEVVKEVVREVPVEVVVEKIVEVEVSVPLPTPTPRPEIDIRKSRNISAGGRLLPTQYTDYYSAHTCALRESGEAVCWGAFGGWDHSERTLEDSFTRYSANAPSGHFREISVGGFHTCALNERGNAVCWNHWDPTRDDYFADSPYDFEFGQSNAPGNRFAALSAGAFHTCALSSDGEVACWGHDGYDRNEIPGGIYMAISAGGWHTCALRDNGDAVCWGRNHANQALDVQGEQFVTITAGGEHTCALRADGTGACWGGSEGSELVPLDGPFRTISAGWNHTCALYEDGEATCWGEGAFGQSSPPSGSFAEIAAGLDQSCGLRHNGEVVCWGNNVAGQSSPARGSFATSDRSTRALTDDGPSDSVAPPASGKFALVAMPTTMLARFSTSDAVGGEARADAAGEIIAQYTSGRADTTRVLDLLHSIAPELSIDERRRAADELAKLSEDDQWDEWEAANAVFYLASIITGDEPNPGERIEAAHELVVLFEAGELDLGDALDLMDIIAPELYIGARNQAAAALMELSLDDDWDDADRVAAASEVFRLVTGIPLDAEGRIGASVDLAGLGVKIFGSEGQWSDQDVAVAVSVIKQAISGDLTSESLASTLGVGG